MKRRDQMRAAQRLVVARLHVLITTSARELEPTLTVEIPDLSMCAIKRGLGSSHAYQLTEFPGRFKSNHGALKLPSNHIIM